MNDTEKPAKRTAATDQKFDGFTDEERGAMKERAKELKAAARPGPRGKEADEESAVLAKIAEMTDSDRDMAERIHALIKASAPALGRDSGTECPPMPRTARSSASSNLRRSSSRGTPRSASMTMQTSTKALCGRPPTP